MGAPQTALTDETGRVVFRGTQAPGGGSQPVMALYSGNAVTVNGNANGDVTWDTLVSGADLLDRSTPGLPTFLAAGTYAVTLGFGGDAQPTTPGGFALYFADLEAPDASVSLNFSTTDAAAVQSGGSVTFVATVPAGTSLEAGVGNHDGSSSHDYELVAAAIVKLA